MTSSPLLPRLQDAVAAEWRRHGFFPCYAAILPQGDPDFGLRDLANFLRSRSDPLLQAAALLLWPARVLRPFQRPETGLSRRVPLESRFLLRFHTFFTDFYFYSIIRRRILPAAAEGERRRWEGILLTLVQTALEHRQHRVLSGETFAVYPFFPRQALEVEANSNAARFLRWSGLENIDPDADDTFVVLEMCADFLAWLEAGGLPWLERGRHMRLRGALRRLLDAPYWALARAYQFRETGIRAPEVNYTGVQPLGGVSTWFGARPADAPDLVVNLNVLRSLLVNRRRWGLLDAPEALESLHALLDFLARNVSSGLFRRSRGYSFYLPEFFAAMFAWLWEVWTGLPAEERALLDPQERLSAVRQAVLACLRDDLHPQRALNPLDAALALGAARRLHTREATRSAGWRRILEENARPQGRPYPAYEIFKGKIPTHMVYGSPAITALFALDALAAEP